MLIFIQEKPTSLFLQLLLGNVWSLFTACTTFWTAHHSSVPATHQPCRLSEILKYLINRRKTCLKAADVQIAVWWAICMESEHSIWIPSISFPTHPPEWPFHLPASQLWSAATYLAQKEDAALLWQSSVNIRVMLKVWGFRRKELTQHEGWKEYFFNHQNLTV